MSTVSIMFLVVGLRLLWTGGVEIFAARQVWPERHSFIGGHVFKDHLYSGSFDILLGAIVVLGALFGSLALDLHIGLVAILLVLFELKCRAVDRLALTVAGMVKAPAESHE